MQINTWYTFDDDNHSYGYTLFCPLKIDGSKQYGKIYGMYIICNDSGPNHGSNPRSWTETGFAYLESYLEENAIEYYDNKGRTPPLPNDLIYQTFTTDGFYFYEKIRETKGWVR